MEKVKKIEIFGTGCPKCKKLYEAADEAAKEMGIDYEISKVQDIKEIVARGVPITPAIAVDGQVVHCGGIPAADKLREFLAG